MENFDYSNVYIDEEYLIEVEEESSIFEDCLILEVQSNPIIFDLSDANYNNQKKKDSVWLKIGENCSRPVKECKKRWKSLRDRFRYLYNKENNTTSGQGSEIKVDWQIYDALKFLIPTITQAPAFSNYNESSSSSQKTSVAKPSNGKRKKDHLEDWLLQYLDTPDVEEGDSDTLFTQSLIGPLRSLSRGKNAYARFKIQQLLYELQFDK